jgi:siroheme synthase-like protein
MPAEASEPVRFLPLALNLRGRDCRIVGGGSIGARKALTLIRTGAEVTVIAPVISEELGRQVETGHVHWVPRAYVADDLEGAFLVVAATDDEAVNASVVRRAGEGDALVCDASSAERSQVIFGALLEGEEVTIAFFTHGRDPRLARKARDEVASLLAGRSRAAPKPES